MRFLVLLVMLLTGATSLAAQSISTPSETGAFFVQTFDPEALGLHPQNWAVAQDPRGLIYVGSSGNAVLEYDGVSWRKISTLNHSSVRSLAVDARGRLYVGAQNDIGYLAPDSVGTLQYISLLEHIPPAARDFSDVWQTFATSQGIYFMAPERLFRWSEEEGMRVWTPETAFHVAFAVDDTLYVRAWDAGLLRMEADSLRMVPGGDRFAQERIYVLLPYDDDRLLVGTRTQGFLLYDGATFAPFPTGADAYLHDHLLYHGAWLGEGLLGLATLRGGFVLLASDGRLVRIINKDAGLQDDKAHFVFPDRQGGAWVALNYGITRIEAPSPFTYFDEDQAGLRGHVETVLHHRGTLYAATHQGLFALEATSLTPRFRPVRGIDEECFSLLSTAQALLAGCHSGVYRIEDGRGTPVQEGATAFVLHRSRRDSSYIYVALHNGLALLHLEDQRWKDAGPVEGLSEEIRSLAEDRDGTLWLGTYYEGLLHARFEAGFSAPPVVERYGDAHGFTSSHTNVFSLENRAVLANAQGLLRPASSTGPPFVPDSTLGAAFADGSYETLNLVQVPNGDAWLKTERTNTGFQETIHARRQPDGTYHLALAPATRFTSHFNVRYIDASGNIWFSGPKGLVRYTPAAPFEPVIPPALIRRVSYVNENGVLFNGAPGHKAAPSIPHTRNALRFEYTLPAYDEAAVSYRYLLDGFDEAWSGWSNQPAKEYTNLPEGAYLFRVQARTIYGTASAEANYAFTILPPWYRTIWAYAAFVLFGTILIAGIVRWRSHQLERRNRHLEQVVHERTAEVEQQKTLLEVLNTELHDANQDLQQATQLKSHLLGMAAHDLRNPLSTIYSSTHILLQEIDAERPMYELVQLMRASAEDMLRLLNDLLDASAIESGKLTLQLQSVDLITTAHQVIQAHQPHARRKDQQLLLTPWLHTTQIEVEADPERLREVMDNLVSNAIKYSPPGGTIRLQVQRHNREVRFSVQDDGPGLSTDDQQKLFNPFQRLTPRPTGQESSSGLGLYIVKHLMDLHGGRVWVESTLGAGSTFFIALPVLGEGRTLDQHSEPERVRSSRAGAASKA